MDWGLAKVLGELERPGGESPLVAVRTDQREEGQSEVPLATMAGSILGTPAYMPPEQAEGRLQELGVPSDVYSVGAMLYHLLAGHAPYMEPGSRFTSRELFLDDGHRRPGRLLLTDAGRKNLEPLRVILQARPTLTGGDGAWPLGIDVMNRSLHDRVKSRT